MEKYVEKKDRKAFDWNKALSKKKIYIEDWNVMASLAASWITCACGNQCSIIPRDDYTGEPLDKILSVLGMEFNDAIEKQDRENAKYVLAQIEKRSLILIERIQNELRSSQ